MKTAPPSPKHPNGFAGKNAYGLTLHGLTEHNKSLFDHFFNFLSKPTFPAKYFSVEKELLNRALHLQKEDPVKQCFKTYNSIVFNEHPYAMDMIGTEKSLKSISRKALNKLHMDNIENFRIFIESLNSLGFDMLDKPHPLTNSKTRIIIGKRND